MNIGCLAMPGITRRPVVLIVDDHVENLSLLSDILSQDYHVHAVTNGPAALQAAAQTPQPDLIILDVMMPEMDGYEVLRHLKARPDMVDTPVILATALSDDGSEERGFQLGAADYVTKPIRPRVVLARVQCQIEALYARRQQKDLADMLSAEVAKALRNFDLAQSAALRVIASLAETRDNETGNHILRTQAYVETLGQYLKHHQRFAALLTPKRLAAIVRAAPLHDIGKVGIPDRILLKPGKLDVDEFEIMKTHATIGRVTIERALQEVAGMEGAAEAHAPLHFEFLDAARDIAGSHHEKWNGSGYPLGLAGDAIPLGARLMAVADVYDALISRRVYKEPIPHPQVVQMISEGAGNQFDPDVVAAFIACAVEFERISIRLKDET